MNHEEIEEKRVSKRKKYKAMKTGLTVSVICGIVLLAACVFSGIALFNMNDKINDLSEKVKLSQDEMEELRETSETLSFQYTILSEEKDKLSIDRDYLAEENLRLSQEVITLQETINGSSTNIEDLKKQLEEKNDKISDLEAKIKTLNSTISKLESQINSLKSQSSSSDNNGNSGNSGSSGNSASSQGSSTTTEKVAYLTFDDGISDATNDILDILKKYNVKATFFVNFAYKKVSGYKDIYKRIIDEGHTLGNHTNTHDFDKVYADIDSFEKEVMDIHNSIKEITGYEMKIFRFPGGSNTTYVRKLGTAPHTLIHELGYEYYDWNVDSGDATAHNVPKETLIKNVLNGATSNSAIILMHDLGYRYKRTTVEALPDIIEGLIKKGYTLKAMNENVTPRQFTKDPKQ